MKKSLVSLLIMLSINTIGYSQDNSIPSFIKDSLDNFINLGMKQWQIPGMSIAIVKDGKVIHSKGYGVKSVKTNEPVDENTLFQIGSITKSFTSTIASMLHEEGKLSLNDKITKWLPYFKLKDELITREVDLYDFLTHRTGFKSYEGDMIFFNTGFDRESVVKKMATFDIEKKFRGSYGYSNSAYTAVGEIIEKATGKSWEENLREKLLKPLRMKNTLPVIPKEHVDNFSEGHTTNTKGISIVAKDTLNYLAPGGSMVSNIKDMATWMMTQINLGEFNGQQVIPARAIRRTRNAYNMQGMDQSDEARTHFYGYGLGFFVRDINGQLTYQHSGGISGFSSNYILVPKERLGIVVLTNTDTNEFYLDLTKNILDSFLGLPFTDYTKESLAAVMAEIKEQEQIVDSLKKEATKFRMAESQLNFKIDGVFSNPSYGQVTINKIGGDYILILGNQINISGKLELLNAKTFLCTFSNHEYGVITVPFEISENVLSNLTLFFPESGDSEYVFKRKS